MQEDLTNEQQVARHHAGRTGKGPGSAVLPGLSPAGMLGGRASHCW